MSLGQRLFSRVRWYELAPEVVLALGLSLFAVTEPRAAGSAFKSTKAVTLMVAVGLGWVLARLATLMAVRWPLVRLAVFGVAALAILKVVVLPTYQNHTVIEALPTPPPASATAPEPAAAQPVKISSGSLRGIDHRASGAVNLYQQSDGSAVVGLEDFDIQPGPAYVVYVVPGSDREDRSGGTRLERLRGNKGTQFYDTRGVIRVPDDPWTVLVWCETFDVPVANATLMSV